MNKKKEEVFDWNKVKTEKNNEIKNALSDIINVSDYKAFKDVNPFMISGIDEIEQEEIGSNRYFYMTLESQRNIDLLRIDNNKGQIIITNKVEFKKTSAGFYQIYWIEKRILLLTIINRYI